PQALPFPAQHGAAQSPRPFEARVPEPTVRPVVGRARPWLPGGAPRVLCAPITRADTASVEHAGILRRSPFGQGRASVLRVYPRGAGGGSSGAGHASPRDARGPLDTPARPRTFRPRVAPCSSD